MVCVSIQGKTRDEIYDILDRQDVEMAEIRLDLCPLDDDDIEDLFGNSDTPLIATCRAGVEYTWKEAEHRLKLAIDAGARFVDLEIGRRPRWASASARLPLRPAPHLSARTTTTSAPLPSRRWRTWQRSAASSALR